jgi:hypothetical protein
VYYLEEAFEHQDRTSDNMPVFESIFRLRRSPKFTTYATDGIVIDDSAMFVAKIT